jgi:hypothetical protein
MEAKKKTNGQEFVSILMFSFCRLGIRFGTVSSLGTGEKRISVSQKARWAMRKKTA